MPDSTPIPTRRILFVAYYFPPMGLSGVQRVTKMVKYLAREGWNVDVLTVRPGGYFAFDESLMADLEDPRIRIHRTRSLDPTRFFPSGSSVSLPGEGSRRLVSSLSQFIFQPDNKVGWIPFARRRGRTLMRENAYEAVVASAPPYSALMAARALAEAAGVPFVADFRDDWMGNPRHTYPTQLHRQLSERMERAVLESADRVLAINETIARSLNERAPLDSPVLVVPQGYDPEDFERNRRLIDANKEPSGKTRDVDSSDGPKAASESGTRTSRVFTLLYTGVFYDAQRPDTFLKALARVVADGRASPGTIRARFAGLFPDSGRALVHELGLDEHVDLCGYLDHEQTIRELLKCDVAWLTIGNRPGAEGISTGKLFEYMGSRKPILALVPPGEAQRALRGYGAERICDPDDVSAAADAMAAFLDEWKAEALPEGNPDHTAAFDRRAQGKLVSGVLESLTR